MNIEKFITEECKYFQPIIERQLNSTQEMRNAWSKETVRERQARISSEVFQLLQGCVKYGPFKNLQLNQETWWGQLDLASQCLGIYEHEVLSIIENIPKGKHKTFIDIGAADGYYALGMLMCGKVQKSICFEASHQGRQVIHRNWEANGRIGKLLIFGEADTESIYRLNSNDVFESLILIDIEGGEFDLLTHAVLQFFASSTIILEVHNWIDGFLEKYANLIRRLDQFFDICPILKTNHPSHYFDDLRMLTDDNRLLLTSERRPCLMRFLLLTPKSGS